VLLPDVADDVFDLVFGGLHHDLTAGIEFLFPLGGVSAFDVFGIETSVGLDPCTSGRQPPVVQFVPSKRAQADRL
jgi:hypothetical protein